MFLPESVFSNTRKLSNLKRLSNVSKGIDLAGVAFPSFSIGLVP